jgi:hypothetical protein
MCGELVTRGEVDGRLKAERGDKELGITVEMVEITEPLVFNCVHDSMMGEK